MANRISFGQFFGKIAIGVVVFCGAYNFSAQLGSAQNRDWDPAEYLARADQNGNGQMDPEEMGGRLKGYMRGLGFSVDQPIPIADVVNRARGSERKKKDKSGDNDGGGGRASSVVRKVPGFGGEFESAPILRFSEEAAANDPATLEKEFGKDVLDRVNQTLETHDENGNGRLDPEEVAKGRWGRPGPEESDLNSDGILSRRELAERYQARAESGDNGRGNDRGRDRDRRDRSSDQDQRESQDRGGNYSEGRGRWRSSQSPSETSDADGRARAKERAREEYARKSQESGGESSSSSGSSKSSSDRYSKFVDGLMKQMDKDGDDALNKEEMKRFRRPPKNTDPNGDGLVTRDELYAAYAREPSGAEEEGSGSGDSKREDRSSRSTSNRNTGRSTNRSSAALFNENDGNGDGLLQMHEFTNDWTMEKINEFKGIDANNDGILTSEEYRNRER